MRTFSLTTRWSVAALATAGLAASAALAHSARNTPGGEMHACPMHESMKHMAHSMPMSGDADRDFAMMMKMHQQHGIAMAQRQLEHGQDPRLKEMAREMVAEHEQDIARFDQWLQARR